MKKLTSVLFLMFILGLTQAQTVLKNDPYHTRMEFRVTHWLVNTVSGNFGEVSFVVNQNDKDFTKSSISFSADIASINTGIQMRDDDLRSANFFDAEKYPKLNFTSNKIVEIAKNVYKVTGNLTMHGVTKPATVILKDRGVSINAYKQKIHGYQVTGQLKRSDFNVGSAPIAEISEEVKITGDFEMVIQ